MFPLHRLQGTSAHTGERGEFNRRRSVCGSSDPAWSLVEPRGPCLSSERPLPRRETILGCDGGSFGKRVAGTSPGMTSVLSQGISMSNR